MSKYLTADNHALFPLIARALLRKAKKEFGAQVSFGLELVCIHRNQAMLQKVEKLTGGIEEIMSKMLNFQEEVRCNASHGWAYRNLAQRVYCLHVYSNQDKISSLVLLEFARIETDSSKLNRLTPDQLAWMTIERQTLKRLLDQFRGSNTLGQASKRYPEDGGVDFQEMKSLKLNSILENALEVPSQVYMLAFFGKNRNSNLKIQEILSEKPKLLRPDGFEGRDHPDAIPLDQLRTHQSTQEALAPGARFSLTSNQEILQGMRSSSGTAHREGQTASEVLISNQNHLHEGERASRSRAELEAQRYQSMSSDRSRPRPEEVTGGFGNPNMSFHEEGPKRQQERDPGRPVSEPRASYFEHNADQESGGHQPPVNGTRQKGSKDKLSDIRDSRSVSSDRYRQQGWRNSDGQVEDLEDQPTHPKPRERLQNKISRDKKPVRSINDRNTTAKRKTIQVRDCAPAKRAYASETQAGDDQASEESSPPDSDEEDGDSYIEEIFRKAGVKPDKLSKGKSNSFGPKDRTESKATTFKKGGTKPAADLAHRTAGTPDADDTEELFGLSKAKLVSQVALLQNEQQSLRNQAQSAQQEAGTLKEEMTKLLEKLLEYKASQRETKKQLKSSRNEVQSLTEKCQRLEREQSSGEADLQESLQAQQTLEEQLARSKAAAFKAQTTADGLQQALKDERSRTAQLREELSASQASYQTERRELLTRIKSLDDALLRAREDAAKERLGAEKNTLDATDYKRKFELTEAKKEELEFKLRQVELEASKLRQELEVKNRHTLEFSLKQELREAEISRLKQDLEAARITASKAEQVLQNTLLEKARLEERSKYQSELGGQNQELANQLQAQGQEIMSLQANLGTANSVIEEKLAEIAGLREKLAKQEKTKRQYHDLKGQVADLKALLAEAEERVEKISLEFLTLRTVTEEKKGEAETLRQRLDFLSQEKDQLQRSAEDHRKRQDDLQSELREAVSERGVHRQEFEAANQRVKAARIENNRLKKENEELAQRVALAEDEIRRIHEATAAIQSQRISSKKEALNDIKDSQNPVTGGGDENQGPASGFRNTSSPHIGRSSRIAQYLRNTAHVQQVRPTLNQSHHMPRTVQDSPDSGNRRSISFATGGKPQGFVGSSRLG